MHGLRRRDLLRERRLPVSEGHPYHPLHPGNAWSYATSQRHGELDLPGVASTLSVLSLREEPGRLIAELCDRVEGPQQQVQESRYQLIATPDGILPGVGVMRVGEHEVRSTDAVGLYLPHALGLDHEWSFAVTYESPLQRTCVRGALRAVAEEEIVVPAGRFRVLLLRGELATELEPAQPEAPLVRQVQHEEQGYAKGVGLVRARTWTDAGYSLLKELTAFRRG